MDAADALRPDVPVERSGSMTIAGRPLSVRVAADAVTAADLWLYDEATGVAVIGDLVTLAGAVLRDRVPGPVAGRARRGLGDAISTRRTRPRRADVPCRVRHVSPGVRQLSRVRRLGEHGQCMRRQLDERSRDAPDRGRRSPRSDGYASYYVDFLRKSGGASPDCQAK